MKKSQPQVSVPDPKLDRAMPTNIAAPASNKSHTLVVKETAEKSRERMVAELNMSPFVANANTSRTFGSGAFGDVSLAESIDVMREKVEKVTAGDLSDVEATLTAQAAALDAIFNELAGRAASNMDEHMNATESFLRLAFKAQAQCRATLETLAEVKYPKAATFVRQQNVAYQQQVNNSASASKNVETNPRTRAPARGESLNK